MFSRSGYQALPLGDFDRFQQSSIGLYGAQKGFFSFGSKADQLGSARNAAGEPRLQRGDAAFFSSGASSRVLLWLGALTRPGWGLLVGAHSLPPF